MTEIIGITNSYYILDIMQRPLTLFLWFSYCITLYSGSAMDNDHVTLRVRDAIRRLPYHSKNNSNNSKRKWQHLIRYEIGAASSLMRRFYGLSSSRFMLSRLRNKMAFQNRKYSSQSVQMADARQAYISSAITNAIFYDNTDNRYNVGKLKLQAQQRPTKFMISDNSNEIVFAPTINSSISSGLSPHQQQQQYNTYHYTTQHFRTTNILPSFSSSRVQEYNTVQSSLYYNPWDPFGLFNNPFWRSIFPNFFAPQPQLFISTTLQPVRSLDFQQRLALIPKKSVLSPNQKLTICCKKQNLSPSCQLLCNYDIISDRSLVNAVILNQCPGNELEMAFNCATSMADHSACCIRNGIGTYGNGHCMVFCTTHLGNPRNALQYLDCLQVFDRIKNCYREYHVVNPNIYGNLRSMES
ncbi:Ig-like and fibronectin type-III domain-containing protein [Dirofilaria immitis]